MSLDLASQPPTPAAETPAVETPVGEAPAGEKPAAERPAPERTRAPLTPNTLRSIVRELAEQPEHWIHHVRLSTEERWYRRLVADEDHEVWLISWLPGQSTGFHDHGGSRGAFTVALGELEELSLGGPDQGLLIRRISAGTTRAFGPEYVHDVRNTASGPAVTLHAYSPPLSSMAHYDLRAGGLVRTSEEGPEQW
ncbi:cysteine dioxygenase family protein [Kitasatospora sp. SUK 42]|uniref:cysteine dioxygenase n=1 Tax=Kitasatospora sp. SUK 42 TaxID=1588882 RepID=UPI0018CADC06|nr:cysteine dioxygenase family protein [Kitasatospora sp. SUK 42]MBV2156333.1 cysteine dioxygenase [Kitasatospora sp. SUK 42]